MQADLTRKKKKKEKRERKKINTFGDLLYVQDKEATEHKISVSVSSIRSSLKLVFCRFD